MPAIALRSARDSSGHVLLRAEVVQRVPGTARLLGAESDEPHRNLGRRRRGQPGQLQQDSDAGRVVLRTWGLRNGVQMGADDDVLGVARRSPGRSAIRFTDVPARTGTPHELPAGTRTVSRRTR